MERGFLKKELVFSILIIVLAGFLRFYRLEEFVTFLGDQGRDAIIIKRILTLEHLPAIGPPTSIGQVYLGPFYYYLIAPFLLIFRYNPLGLAFGVALLSLVGIIAAFWIIVNEIGIRSGLIFLILVGFSAVNIEFSRFSWNPNLLPFFSFFTLYFFYLVYIKKIKKGRPSLFFKALLAGGFFSFSIQLHYLGLFLFFPLGIVLFKGYIEAKDKPGFFNRVLISGFSFIFFTLPLLIFDLRHNFINLKNFIHLFRGNKVINNTSFVSRVIETNYWFLSQGLNIGLNKLIALVVFAILIGGVFYLMKRGERQFFIGLHLLNTVGYIFFFSLLDSPRYPHYYGVIYISFFLLLAWFFGFFWKKNILLKLAVVFLIGFYLFNNIKNYDFLFNKPTTSQIEKARRIALSILPKIKKRPYQVVALPVGETDGHIRYFLEINGQTPMAEDSVKEPQELFVLCFRPECSILGNSQWQIASFKRAKIDKIWQIKGVRIYKLVHEK